MQVSLQCLTRVIAERTLALVKALAVHADAIVAAFEFTINSRSKPVPIRPAQGWVMHIFNVQRRRWLTINISDFVPGGIQHGTSAGFIQLFPIFFLQTFDVPQSHSSEFGLVRQGLRYLDALFLEDPAKVCINLVGRPSQV
jgi:hypothetical protein